MHVHGLSRSACIGLPFARTLLHRNLPTGIRPPPPMISAFLILLLVWACASLTLLLCLHGRTLRALWLEPTLGVPVIIVESDDWGVGPRSDAQMLASMAATLAGI